MSTQTVKNILSSLGISYKVLSGLKVADVTLSVAQILALNATPITVIAAPGAAKAIVIDRVVATKDAGTAYAGIATGEDIALKYTDASGVVAATIEPTGFLDSTAATIATATGALSPIPVVNAAVVAHMLVGEITTGDSPVKLRIYYRVANVPVFA